MEQQYCVWLCVILFLGSIQARSTKRHHEDLDEEEDGAVEDAALKAIPHHRKSVSAPVLVFGNSEVLGSSFVQGSNVNSNKRDFHPISIELYEKGTSELSSDSDDAYVRNLIIKRFKRSPKAKAVPDQKNDDEEDEDAEREAEEEEDDDEEATKQKNATTLKPSSKPASQNNTTIISTTTAKPTSSSPIVKNGTVASKPSPPGVFGGKLPPGFVLPPGASLPGKPGSRPPPFPPGGKLPFPPHLLFGNRNASATPKPAKKGELYLPEDYNNLEIPKLDAGKLFGLKLDKLSPVPVLVFLNIRSVRDIDESNEEIVLDMDMKVEWVDGILFDPFNAIRQKPMKPTTLNPVFLKKIWQPDVYIDEVVRVHRTQLMAKPHTLLFSSGTGLISYTFRIAVRLSCDMNFYFYPSDTQKCEFHLRSYSYFDSDLDLGWLRNGVFLQDPGDPNFDLRVDDIKKLKIKQIFNEANNDTYDGLSFVVVARRKLSFHMVQTYLPSVFFIVITWLCFLVPARMVEARIGISMTTLLTLTAMFSSVRESTPIVSYVKAIDIWMVFCIFFVFLTLLEFSLLVWIRSFREDAEEKRLEHEREMQFRRGVKESQEKRSPSLTPSVKSDDLKRYEIIAEFFEKWAFLIFSIIFFIFNIIYWSWLLTASDYFNWSVNASHNGALIDE